MSFELILLLLYILVFNPVFRGGQIPMDSQNILQAEIEDLERQESQLDVLIQNAGQYQA